MVHVGRDASGYIPAEKFADAIDENTQLVAITHVCFRNGAKLEIPEIVRIARAKGAMVLLDCYQAVGSMDINVKKLDVDFAVGGMLKYLLGTAGIGFMYVRDSFTKSLVPTNSGWFAQEDIGAILTGRPPTLASEEERAVYEATRCILDAGTLDAQEYDRYASVLSVAHLFELVTLIGYYSMLATQLSVFDIQPPAHD